jgi:excisionase family DNA binding protein
MTTIADAARQLSLSEDKIVSWIRNGSLRALDLDGDIRIRESDLEALLESRVVQPAPVAGRKRCKTFGGRKEFDYQGSVRTGVRFYVGKSGAPVEATAEQLRELLGRFGGQTVEIGSSFDKPRPGSMGAWLNEHRTQGQSMGRAVYVGGILIAEGFAESVKRGYIRIFPAKPAPNDALLRLKGVLTATEADEMKRDARAGWAEWR